MAEPSDPLDAGLLLAAAFEAAQVPYALGGALAYGFWGVPRATIDVDVNVFVKDDGLADVFAALAGLGISVDEAAARAASQRDGLFIVSLGAFRVDLFTPSIEFSWEAERSRVRRTVEHQQVWFLSAEALAVFKLLFFRTKDIADLERLVAMQGPHLDTDYVRRHVVTMMGEADERVRRWDELVSAFGDTGKP